MLREGEHSPPWRPWGNAPTIGAEVHLPFGGVKKTGFAREAGTTAMEEFTYVKTVYVDYSGRLQRAQLDTENIGG